MNSKVASFVLTTLTLVLTVSAYAYLVIGKHIHNDGSLALTAKEIPFLQTSAIIYSLVPGLLAAAYFSRISQRRPRYKSSLLFTLFFISTWLFSAYLIAGDWRAQWRVGKLLLEAWFKNALCEGIEIRPHSRVRISAK